MTILEKPATKEKRLLSYRKGLRGVPLEDIVAPTPTSIVLLPATTDDLGNQLHTRDQGLPMELSFSRFPTSNYPDNSNISVQALFNGTPVGSPLDGVTPLKDEFFDQTLTVPAGHTGTAREHEVQYRVKYRLNDDDSLKLIVRVDTQAPALTTEVKVPDEIKNDGITAEYFDSVNFVLLEYISTYGDAKIGDVVAFWIKESGAPVANATLIDSLTRTDLAIPLKTEKLTKTLVGIDDGKVEIYTVVTDRKGNKSQPSPMLEVDVSLFPAPKSEVVSVDLHDDDNVILFEDARSPVTAVLNYQNFKSGDKWRLSVDHQTPALEPDITVVPSTNGFTYKYLQNGNDGPKTVDFTWQVRRGNKLYPETPHNKQLTIDLRKPGVQPDPDNPGLPGSPDPKLELITVQGVHPTKLNYLIKQDAANGAIAFVKIHEGHKAGDEVHLIYHGAEVEESDGGVVKLDGTENDDTVLQFRIPADYVKGTGNTKVARVEYIVSHDLNATTARSGVKYVEVYVDEIPMPQGDFAITGDAGDGPELYCGSLQHNADLGTMAVEVKFPPSPELKDTKIKFLVMGYENVTDGSGKNAPGLLIPGAVDTVEKTPTAAEATAGFSVYFSYHVFEKIKNGWCELNCIAVQQGYITPSGPRLFRVGMELGGGDFCKIS